MKEVMLYCLFKDGESHEEFVKAEGITKAVGFHPGRLEEKKPEIAALLKELPGVFMQTGQGKGMSFLEMCVNKDGHQWGEHVNMEELVLLGLAAGYVELLLPRNMWSVIPGGMPYYAVRDDKM